MEKQRKKSLIVHGLLLCVFLAALIALSIVFGPRITRLISRPDKFKEFLLSYGPTSAIIYILFQVTQVVIAAIPGEIIQIAGGYVFGTPLGTLYSVIGILLGTMIVFFLTRLIGYSLVKMFVPRNKMGKFEFLINSPKSEIAMFVLFLIPGLPKDTLVYIAGLTPIKPLRFLAISAVARFPGLLGSAYIGANLQRKHYLPVTIISAGALALFVVGLLVKDRVIAWLHDLRHSPEKNNRD